MNNPRAELGTARSDIAGDFRMLAEHAEELLQATRSATGDSARQAREQLNESLRQARIHLGNAHTRAMERTRHAMDSAVGYARERPYQALGAAILVGAAVGLAMTITNRSRGRSRY